MSFRYPKGGFIQLFFDPLTPGPDNNFGPLYTMGNNGDAQLGLNDLSVNRSSPTQVGSISDWATTAGGNGFCFSIKTDGTLWGWGNNASGQLGQNNRINTSSPVQVGALTNWTTVSAGNSFTTAIKTNGTLWTWGNNALGQLGQNDVVNRSSPVQVGALTTWSNAVSGFQGAFMIALKTDGTLWSWGRNDNGQLGDGTVVYRSSPVQVGALTTWTSIAAGTTSAHFINSSGQIYSVGANGQGQLGLNIANTIQRSSPSQIGSLTNWSKVNSGVSHVLSIKTDNTLWSFGRADRGQLGDNTVVNRSSPIQVGALATWSKIYSGDMHSLSIKTDGTLWLWGYNNNGQLGFNDLTSRSSPVQLGTATNWLWPGAGVECSAIVQKS